jgi:hypothetical protein
MLTAHVLLQQPSHAARIHLQSMMGHRRPPLTLADVLPLYQPLPRLLKQQHLVPMLQQQLPPLLASRPFLSRPQQRLVSPLVVVKARKMKAVEDVSFALTSQWTQSSIGAVTCACAMLALLRSVPISTS